jgi:hypothetical protein
MLMLDAERRFQLRHSGLVSTIISRCRTEQIVHGDLISEPRSLAQVRSGKRSAISDQQKHNVNATSMPAVMTTHPGS